MIMQDVGIADFYPTPDCAGKWLWRHSLFGKQADVETSLIKCSAQAGHRSRWTTRPGSSRCNGVRDTNCGSLTVGWSLWFIHEN
jgi:hypothetical protein